MKRSATPNNVDETEVLKAKLEAAEQRISDKDKTIDDLRQRLDQESEERRKLTLMLTHGHTEKQAAQPPQKTAGGFWQRLRSLTAGKP